MSGQQLDDDQTFLAFIGMIFGPAAFAAVLGIAAAKIPALVEFLVQVKVLAPASAHPLLSASWLQGAGLDLPRIVILAVLILLPTIWAVHRVGRRDGQEAKR